MKTRTITGIVALVLLLPFVWYGSWPLVLGACIMGVIGVSEFFRMKKKRFLSMTGLLTSIITIFIILPKDYFDFLPEDLGIWHLYFVFGMMLLVMTVLSNNEFTYDDAGGVLLAALYVGNGFHYFIRTAEMGFLTVVFVLFTLWATDIGAYILGMRFGKHKLAPIISPNKSIEGSVGGMVSSIVVAIIYTNFHNPEEFTLAVVIILAILISIIGQLGDLTESAFKRHFGVKDSGKILPGHGGILDRFDSMLFVMPMFQIFLTIYRMF